MPYVEVRIPVGVHAVKNLLTIIVKKDVQKEAGDPLVEETVVSPDGEETVEETVASPAGEETVEETVLLPGRTDGSQTDHVTMEAVVPLVVAGGAKSFIMSRLEICICIHLAKYFAKTRDYAPMAYRS